MSDDEYQVSDCANSPPPSLPVSPPPSPPSTPTPRARTPTVQNIVRILVHATTANVTINSGQHCRTPCSVPLTPSRQVCTAKLETVALTPDYVPTVNVENTLPRTTHSILPENCIIDHQLWPPAPRLRTSHPASDAGYQPDQVFSPPARGCPDLQSPKGLVERNRRIQEALDQHWSRHALPALHAFPITVYPSPTAEPLPSTSSSPCECKADLADTEINPLKEYIEGRDRQHYGNWYVITAGTRVGVFKTYSAVQRYTSSISRASQQSVQTYSEAVRMYIDFKARGLVDVLPE